MQSAPLFGLIFAVLSVAVYQHAQGETQLRSDANFDMFKAYHAKEYAGNTAESRAKSNFQKQKEDINAHNLAYSKGLTTYTRELNEFSDIDPAEFSKRNGFRPDDDFAPIANFSRPANLKAAATLPASFDWRSLNKTSPVLNQGSCGCCFAFAAAGAMESQVLLKGHAPMQFSEQQITDCNTVNYGCGGGNFKAAWNYTKSNGGLQSYASYPYTNGNSTKAGTCKSNAAKNTATVTGYTVVATDYTSVMTALVNYGPLAIALDGSQPGIQTYSGGVYTCSKTPTVNHAVLLVGYGTTSTGIPYWNVKNSWGTNFGNGGYFLLSRNKTSDCGMMSFAYPAVVIL